MLLQSLRYGVRIGLRRPGFAALAVAILGLGIGVNSAMFSLLNTLLFHPLPYRDLNRVLAVSQANPQRGLKQQLVSIPDYDDWRRENTAFERLAAWNFQFFNLTGADRPERLEGLKVTSEFFDTLGVHPSLGRSFAAEDEEMGRDHAVVLSDGLWRRRFGGDAGIVGRTVLVENQPHVVVGVLPPDFRLFRVLNRELDLFIPLTLNPVRASRADHVLFVYAKLKAGVSLAQARSTMGVLDGRIADAHPDTSAGWRAEMMPLKEQWASGSRPFLTMAQIAAGLVLLIACANIAGLLLAHGVGRRQEMAVRVALGASWFALVRQMLIESTMLGAASALAGTALSFGLIRALNGLPYSVINRVEPFRVDATVLAFNVAVGLAAGLLAGLAPAMQASAQNLKPNVMRGRRACHVLVASEAALAVVLLVGAGLLLRSSLAVAFLERGIDTHGMLTGQVWLPPARYQSGRDIASFWRELVSRVSALPGVRSVSAVNFLPLSVLGTSTGVVVEGAPVKRPGEEPQVQYWVAGPDYFPTVSLRVLEGRVFDEHDDDEAHGVTVVSASMAARFWPGQSALGHRLQTRIGDTGHYWLPKSENRWLTVVGVVGDVRLDGISQNALPQMYLPYGQNPSAILHLLVRTNGDPYRWSAALRQVVLAMDKDQPLFDEKSLDDVLANSVTRSTSATQGLALAAGIALLLAGVGIYGIASYVVSQQMRETGIRMALGASPRDVMGGQVTATMRTVVAGSAIGVAASMAGARVLGSTLVGVAPTDGVTLVLAPIFFLIVAGVASWVPARRAARVDPWKSLREN
jgi:putative ABC transport system permease protein